LAPVLAAILGLLPGPVGARAESANASASGAPPPGGAGLVLWLDAQELARTGRLSDGSPIECWGDRSGRGHHALQDRAAYQPTLRLATKETALPAVRFDASKKQHLSIPAGGELDLRRLTAFVVARARAGPANMWLLGKNHWGPP